MDTPIAANRPVDPRAHNEYLLGVYQMELRGAEPLEQAIGHFQKALDFDPEYVPALARLAMTLIIYPYYAAGISRQDYINKAAPYAERAYALHPDSWEANLAMGSDRWQRAVINGTTRAPAIEFFQRAEVAPAAIAAAPAAKPEPPSRQPAKLPRLIESYSTTWPKVTLDMDGMRMRRRSFSVY